MDELLFPFGHTYFIEAIWKDIFLLLIIMSGIYFLWLFLEKKYQRKKQSKKILDILATIHPSDVDFADKFLVFLKKYLSPGYQPKNPPAHTEQELSRYVREDVILDVIQQLEQSQYSGMSLSIPLREELLNKIKNILSCNMDL